MKKPWQYQRDLSKALADAEKVFLESLYEEAFQHGVERGRFEERARQREAGEKK